MQENTRGAGGRVGKTWRAHPVALALIAVELGWLAISGTSGGERLRKSVSGTSARAKALTGQLREKVMDMTGSTRSATSRRPYSGQAGSYAYAREKSNQRMGQAMDEAASASADLQGKVDESLAGARERFGGAIGNYPFLSLVLALLAGAAISLAIPAKPASNG